MWQSFLAFLASLAADPAALDREAPKAAAAVAAAYAGFATEEKPTPVPTPDKDACCKDCGGKGYIVQPDGHRTACPCPSSCKCKQALNRAGCPDGKCAVPGASPASVLPARPAGGR